LQVAYVVRQAIVAYQVKTAARVDDPLLDVDRLAVGTYHCVGA
jgi:hypothetical protein